MKYISVAGSSYKVCICSAKSSLGFRLQYLDLLEREKAILASLTGRRALSSLLGTLQKLPMLACIFLPYAQHEHSFLPKLFAAGFSSVCWNGLVWGNVFFLSPLRFLKGTSPEGLPAPNHLATR